MRNRLHNRLPHWHRRLVYALVALLVLTGLAWLAFAYLLAEPGADTPAPHFLAGPLLAVHGMVAYAALVACGLVGHVHLRNGWRMVALRPIGLVLCLALLGLALTGLGFYYVANEAATPWLRWLHVAGGVALPGVLALHIARGRRATRHA